jgi:hypothetical protein
MRSKLVFCALAYVSNPYVLVRLALEATRKIHTANTRIQETSNDVLARFSRASPVADARLTKTSKTVLYITQAEAGDSAQLP